MARLLDSIRFALRFSSLVMGLLRGTGPAADYLRERGVTPDRFLSALEGLFAGPSEPPRSNQPAE